jgi:RsiW-degrading membrane proteinase PrsW (M82 family)
MAVLAAALPLGLLVWLQRSLTMATSTRRLLLVVLGGAAAAALAEYLERLVLGLAGLSLQAPHGAVGGALLAMFLFAAPLEEGLEVLVVWPAYRSRALSHPLTGLLYAAGAGAGFAAMQALIRIAPAPPSALLALRMVLSAPARLFFASAWGVALGSGRRARGRWFSLTWLSAMLLHGLYEHIVFGRGPGLLVATLPMLAALVVASWIALRDLGSQPSSLPSTPRLGIPLLPEPPSVGAMRRALSRAQRPLMVRWIAIGALVTLGIMLTLVTAAVVVGNRVGVDFALADEGDVGATGPLLLLGAAVLGAFPLAGYLVVRASPATGMLEPALGAGLAILLLVGLTSITAPVAVVLVLAAAPIAFALACGGAWFGLSR